MRKPDLTIFLVGIILVTALSTPRVSARTLTVDCNGLGDFTSIQEAINSAFPYDTIVVRPCVYYEKIDFFSKSITITSTNPDDVNVVGATIIDGNGVGNVVLFNNGEDDTSILVGLTVQNGQNGIYCYYSSPLIEKCVITNNTCGIQGSSAAPKIRESIIEGNRGSGIVGCGGEISRSEIIANSGNGLEACYGQINDCEIISNSYGVISYNGQINNCKIIKNQAHGLMNCNVQIKNCVIRQNCTGISNSSGDVLNCIVSGNCGPYGIWYHNGQIMNCIIAGNKGDGLYLAGGVVSNSIIVQNVGVGFCNPPTMSRYNNVWHNLGGNGVPSATDISKNPLFAVPGYWDQNNNWVEGEYHLMSTAGRWDPAAQTWVIDPIDSPSIDAGDPCSPIGLEPNPNGGRINQGVYGGTAEASKSSSGIVEPVCKEYPAMDFNKDCKVDFEDFAVFAEGWLECNLDPPSACWD